MREHEKQAFLKIADSDARCLNIIFGLTQFNTKNKTLIFNYLLKKRIFGKHLYELFEQHDYSTAQLGAYILKKSRGLMFSPLTLKDLH